MVTAKVPGEPLTYGVYLRVPELLDLQSPLSKPEVHDEMLFILGQQAQELWFKQILHELRAILEALEHSEILQAVRLLDRVNRILRILSQETDVLATLEPRDFNRFNQGVPLILVKTRERADLARVRPHKVKARGGAGHREI